MGSTSSQRIHCGCMLPLPFIAGVRSFPHFGQRPCSFMPIFLSYLEVPVRLTPPIFNHNKQRNT